MAEMREVDADLVFPAGERLETEQSERGWRMETGGWSRQFTIKSPFDPKFCLRERAAGAHAVFDGDDARFILAQRRVNNPLLRRDVSVDDGAILFFNGTVFQNFSEFTRDLGIFGNNDHAAGFAVQAV